MNTSELSDFNAIVENMRDESDHNNRTSARKMTLKSMEDMENNDIITDEIIQSEGVHQFND